jgi:hypothetical protein
MGAFFGSAFSSTAIEEDAGRVTAANDKKKKASFGANRSNCRFTNDPLRMKVD